MNTEKNNANTRILICEYLLQEIEKVSNKINKKDQSILEVGHLLIHKELLIKMYNKKNKEVYIISGENNK